MDNLFFVMSLSGTVVFLLYLLFYTISAKYFHVTWRYNILKLSFFFFLFPLGYFKYRIFDVIDKIWPVNWTHKNTSDNEFFIVFADGIYMSKKVQLVWIFLIISAVFAIVLIMLQMIQYYKIKQLFQFIAKDIKHELTKEEMLCFNEIKNEFNIKKDIKIIISENVDVPGVIGVFRPMIYIPYCLVENNRMAEQNFKYILKHEMIHIKHKDLLFKFIAFLVIAVNWYNPFVYVLFYEVCNMCEICCDKELLKSEDEKFIKQYGELLLDIASQSKSPFHNNKFIYGLINNDKKVLKRRILEMKRGKRKRFTVISTFVGVLIFLLGASSALVYNPNPKIIAEEAENIDIEPSTTGGFEPQEQP